MSVDCLNLWFGFANCCLITSLFLRDTLVSCWLCEYNFSDTHSQKFTTTHIIYSKLPCNRLFNHYSTASDIVNSFIVCSLSNCKNGILTVDVVVYCDPVHMKYGHVCLHRSNNHALQSFSHCLPWSDVHLSTVVMYEFARFLKHLQIMARTQCKHLHLEIRSSNLSRCRGTNHWLNLYTNIVKRRISLRR